MISKLTILETFIDLARTYIKDCQIEFNSIIVNTIGNQQEFYKELEDRSIKTTWNNLEDGSGKVKYKISLMYPEDAEKPCKLTYKEQLEDIETKINHFKIYLRRKLNSGYNAYSLKILLEVSCKFDNIFNDT